MYSTEESSNVEQQAKRLGCQVPTGTAILPRNFFEANSKADLVHENNATSLRIMLRQSNIVETKIEAPGEKIPVASEHGFTGVVLPTIFFAFAAVSQDTTLVSVALNVVSNYLTDFFKGRTEEKSAKLKVVIEDKLGNCRRVEYTGSVDGILPLEKVILALVNEKEEKAQKDSNESTTDEKSLG